MTGQLPHVLALFSQGTLLLEPADVTDCVRRLKCCVCPGVTERQTAVVLQSLKAATKLLSNAQLQHSRDRRQAGHQMLAFLTLHPAELMGATSICVCHCTESGQHTDRPVHRLAVQSHCVEHEAVVPLLNCSPMAAAQ